MANSWDYKVGDLLKVDFHGRKTRTGIITRKFKSQSTRYPFPDYDKWNFEASDGFSCTLIQTRLDNTKTITVLARANNNV